MDKNDTSAGYFNNRNEGVEPSFEKLEGYHQFFQFEYSPDKGRHISNGEEDSMFSRLRLVTKNEGRHSSSPNDEAKVRDGLRLTKVFLRINSAEDREQVIKLAERLADSPPLENR